MERKNEDPNRRWPIRGRIRTRALLEQVREKKGLPGSVSYDDLIVVLCQDALTADGGS